MPVGQEDEKRERDQPQGTRLPNTSAVRSARGTPLAAKTPAREEMALDGEHAATGRDSSSMAGDSTASRAREGSANVPSATATPAHAGVEFNAMLNSERHQHMYYEQRIDSSRMIQGNSKGATAQDGERGNIYYRTLAGNNSAVLAGNATREELNDFFHGSK